MNRRHRLFVLAAILLGGCSSGASPGTEAAARQHLDSEFRKWVAGQETDVSTMKFRTGGLLAPISYQIRSVVPDKPDPLAFSTTGERPADWTTWPAWRLNAAIEWKSEAGTPVEKVTTYTLTWNARERKWYVGSGTSASGSSDPSRRPTRIALRAIAFYFSWQFRRY